MRVIVWRSNYSPELRASPRSTLDIAATSKMPVMGLEIIMTCSLRPGRGPDAANRARGHHPSQTVKSAAPAGCRHQWVRPRWGPRVRCLKAEWAANLSLELAGSEELRGPHRASQLFGRERKDGKPLWRILSCLESGRTIP
jgi:hypothetical protein